jgi:hypothetical protein
MILIQTLLSRMPDLARCARDVYLAGDLAIWILDNKVHGRAQVADEKAWLSFSGDMLRKALRIFEPK